VLYPIQTEPSSGLRTQSAAVELADIVRIVAGDAPEVVLRGAKTIYRNPQTGLQVVYDVAGNYFRVHNPAVKGVLEYLDAAGNEIPANVPLLRGSGGYTLTGVSKDVRQALTHFTNSDPLPRLGSEHD
jgi:hypothetical protein